MGAQRANKIFPIRHVQYRVIRRIMRSSKSRSRNKQGRNRPVGNVVNRVFDSSGPEGKVRGTPQQIIEKYNQLARDAQLANDRVATENFQQHAEHYMRLLGEAQREMEARRGQQERDNREKQAERDRNRNQNDQADTQPSNDPADSPQPDVFGMGDSNGDSGLVDTPEMADASPQKPAKPARVPRKRPTSKVVSEATPSEDAKAAE